LQHQQRVEQLKDDKIRQVLIEISQNQWNTSFCSNIIFTGS
jgi:hypothetical protein